MSLPDKPSEKPVRPEFSSGPCAKRPGWSCEHVVKNAYLGRSHRAAEPKAQLKNAIEKTRNILNVPQDYKIGIVPASDTGAYEMAMWTMLGARGVDMMAWESFGEGWVTDAVKQLKLDDCRTIKADYGHLPDLSKVRADADVCFTWNGTTSGARVPHADWISSDREGLTICDATSAVFAQKLDWQKLDVVTFSWQKAMGGEGAHGVLILGPRAVERLESYKPTWPLPKIFRLTKNGKLIDGIFSGATINTPSMLCVADYMDTLNWAEEIGGLPALQARADENFDVIQNWVDKTDWIENLVTEPSYRSNTSVCLKITDKEIAQKSDEVQQAFVKKMVKLLEKEHVAYDINGYRDAPAGLRIWCGCTIDANDLRALTPWLKWAFHHAKSA